MTSAICTLVEGDYHLGLGALANSLVHHGFQGVIWVGLRGPLPPWAGPSKPGGAWTEFAAAPGVVLRFVAMTTPVHLTNFKPEFMHQVWTLLDPMATRLFYFDPDIVVKAPWSFFEEWTGYGVALVDDVNSPLPETHPRRGAWRHALSRQNRRVCRETPHYVNGGFVGLAAAERGFLDEWREAMVLVGAEIGGLEASMFSFGTSRPDRQSPAYPFSKTDQDALNIAVMTSPQAVSVMGAEGMDFRPGGWTMSHALGPEKPWRRPYVRAALAGRPPTPADRAYWEHAAGPIAVVSPLTVAWRRFTLTVAGAIGRWYRRN